MRIVFIITDYGSFNNFLAEIAYHLIDSGNTVDVICSQDKVINYEDKHSYREIGIKFHFVNFPRGFNLFKQIKASRHINKLIRQIAPDIVSIHFTTAMFTTLLTGKPATKTIGTFHGVGYPMVRGKFKRIIFKIVEEYCINRLDQVWLLNQSDFDLLSRKRSDKVKLLETKGLGCDLAKFNVDNFNELSCRALKHSLGFKKDDYILTFTGRYVDFKGFDVLIKTFRYMTETLRIENIKLILIGGKDRIHDTGLDTNDQIWFEKQVNIVDIGFTSDVARYLSITDLFVFPSEREGMPVCIIEALAMGVPVITTNTRGCNDLIQDGINGLLLESDSTIHAVASKILYLKNDYSLYMSMTKNIRRNRLDYDRHNFVKQQLNMFKNLYAK